MRFLNGFNNFMVSFRKHFRRQSLLTASSSLALVLAACAGLSACAKPPVVHKAPVHHRRIKHKLHKKTKKHHQKSKKPVLAHPKRHTHFPKAKYKAKHKAKFRGHRLPNGITRLVADSNMGLKLYLEDGAPQSFYQVKTPLAKHPFDNPLLYVHTKGHVLYVRALGSQARHPNFEVYLALKNLKSVKVSGRTSLVMHDNGPHLAHLDMQSKMPVGFDGQLAPEDVFDSGSGVLSMKWTKPSKHLHIHAGSYSDIELDGPVDMLSASLSHHSWVDGSRLFAKHAYIRSGDYSLINLHVAEALHAFAYGHSQISYYDRPPMMSRVSRQHANILQQAA